MCGFSFTFDFLFCMWCCTCTVTGKSSKDKENVRLTGFDVIRERHNSNSEAPFNNSVPGVPPEGVWQLSPLALWLDRGTKKVYSLKVSLQCNLSVKMCITKKIWYKSLLKDVLVFYSIKFSLHLSLSDKMSMHQISSVNLFCLKAHTIKCIL